MDAAAIRPGRKEQSVEEILDGNVLGMGHLDRGGVSWTFHFRVEVMGLSMFQLSHYELGFMSCRPSADAFTSMQSSKLKNADHSLIVGGGVTDIEREPMGRHGHWDNHGRWDADAEWPYVHLAETTEAVMGVQ